MPESDNTRLPSRRPGVATAEQGAVLLDGPKGVVVALTPEAAHATSENLRRAAAVAARQRREVTPSEGGKPVLVRPTLHGTTSDFIPGQRAGKKETTMANPARQSDKDLSDLFEHALKDIYYAEKKIYRSLPKMIKAAEDQELRQALTDHREETADQIAKLEQVFELIGKRPKTEKCDAIDGILEEGEGILTDFGTTPAGDAGIVFSCQAVEHYEISRYGAMQAWATGLGMEKAATILAGILEQEKAADAKLTALAESRVNHAAEALGA